MCLNAIEKMTSIDLSQIASIPFVDVANFGGRFLGSLTFHDGERWRVWFPTVENTLVEVRSAWPAEGYYFAKVPQSPEDMHFRFLNFVAQHAAFPDLKLAVTGIMDDIANLSASLSKLKLLHSSRESVEHGLERMAATEVEYILLVCRSLFDLLQEVATKLWDIVQPLDPAQRKGSMKRSFADVAIIRGVPATAKQLTEKYGLPQDLADFYATSAPFFIELKKMRDSLIHSGSPAPQILHGDLGFLVPERLRPFSALGIWREDERKPNGLVPLMPAIAVIVYRTLIACERFSIAMRNNIALPPELVPGMAYFMRGYFNDYFVEVMEDARIRDFRSADAEGASADGDNADIPEA